VVVSSTADRAVSTESSSGAASLERRMNRLASERTHFFGTAGTSAGLSRPEQARLKTIERELDDCFVLRRQQRAARDAHRFSDRFASPPLRRAT
jgi:hypothetical protein